MAKAKPLRLPLAHSETAYPSCPTLSEHMVFGCELSHIGGPTRVPTTPHPPPQATGGSCFTFCCIIGPTAKQGPAASEHSSPRSLKASLSELLGSPGPRASCSKADKRCSSASKCLCTPHWCGITEALSISASGQARNPPQGQRRKRELTAFNAFSALSGEPPTASQSSTGAPPRGSHPHGITYYVVAAVFLLPLEPQGILCLLGILPASATVLLILFMIAVLLLLTPFLLIVEPRAGKVQAERLKEL